MNGTRSQPQNFEIEVSTQVYWALGSTSIEVQLPPFLKDTANGFSGGEIFGRSHPEVGGRLSTPLGVYHANSFYLRVHIHICGTFTKYFQMFILRVETHYETCSIPHSLKFVPNLLHLAELRGQTGIYNGDSLRNLLGPTPLKVCPESSTFGGIVRTNRNL